MEIKRDVLLARLLRHRHNGMIKVITGMRRCGKSYLLFNLFADALKAEGVDDGHIIKVNLEDRRNKELRDPDTLLHYIDDRLKDGGMHYVLLDEIQLVSEFEDVLNSYLHVDNADVYVTGSNARFLSNETIKGGVYRYSRNPMYFAFTLGVVAVCIATASLWLLLALIPFVISTHAIILGEERYCETTYGESYLAYKKKTPRYFLFF